MVFNRRSRMFSCIRLRSDNNVVSQRLLEKLHLPTTFHPNHASIKFSTWQRLEEVLCDIAPMDSCVW